MADNVGIKLEVEGEAELKKALREINNDFKLLGSEMNLVIATFGKQNASMEASAAQSAIINKEIEAQKNKIDLLTQALENAKTSFGENDKRTKNWAIQLNNAKAALLEMESSLKKNESALSQNNKSIENTAKQSEKANSQLIRLGDAVLSSGKGFLDSNKNASAFSDAIRGVSSNATSLGVALKSVFSDGALSSGFSTAADGAKQLGSTIIELGSGGMKAGMTALVSIAKELGAALWEAAKLAADAFMKLLEGGVDYNAQIESYKASFTTLLGSAEEADKLLGGLKNFAEKTPFELSDLSKASETLLAFGEDSKSLEADLKMLGDIALGNRDKFNGLALVFGQVQSAGKLAGQDLNQMINQGFNPLTIISEQTGIAMSELKDIMSDGAITFEMVADAMKVATSEGGQFFNAMETQSRTFEGQVSTLADNFNALTGSITSGFFNAITTQALPAINGLVEGFSMLINSQEGASEKIARSSQEMSEAISEAAPAITDMILNLAKAAEELIEVVANSILTSLPDISDAAYKIVDTIFSALSEAMPIVSDAAMKIMTTLLNGLVENFPAIGASAIEIVTSLVNAISDSLPELVPVVLEAILVIAETLLNNAEPILSAAANLIKGLAEGLINALPLLIAELPKIITTIIDFLSEGIVQVIELGVELIGALISGIISSIPYLIAELPKILIAIVESLTSGFEKITECGVDIVKSLWNGIVSMGSWLWEKVNGLIKSVIDAIDSAISGKHASISVGVSVDVNSTKKASSALVNSVSNAEKKIQQITRDSAKSQVVVTNEATKAKINAKNQELSFNKLLTDSNAKTASDSAKAAEKASKDATKAAEKAAADQKRAAEQSAKDQEKIAKELAMEEAAAAKEKAAEINRIGDGLTKALKNRYSEQKNAALDAIDAEVEAVKSASYEKIKIYDEEYAEKLKYLDEEEYRRLKLIQGEIDALDAKTAAEERARKESEYEEKLNELKVEFSLSDTNEEQNRIQKEVNRLVADRQREITREQREAQKKSLEEQYKEQEKYLKEKRDELEKSKLEELQIQKEGIKESYDELISGEALKAEALKLMITEQNDEIINLLESYYPEWNEAGKKFSDYLMSGIAENSGRINDVISGALGGLSISDVPVEKSQGGIIKSVAETSSITPRDFSEQSDDLKNALISTKDVFVQLAESIKKVSGEIATIIQSIKSEIDALTGLSSGIATLTDAINNFKSVLVQESQREKTPTFSNVFNFDNITVRNQSDMQTIADFVFRKIQVALHNRGVRI